MLIDRCMFLSVSSSCLSSVPCRLSSILRKPSNPRKPPTREQSPPQFNPATRPTHIPRPGSKTSYVNISFPIARPCPNTNMTPYLLSLFVFAVATGLPTRATALDVPRVTPAQLDQSKLLQSGKVPFILTQSMEDWESRTKFNDLDWFAEHFPDAIVDYYPENLATVEKKPFLRKMASVLNEFSVPNPKPAGGWSQNGRSEKARYIHWRMTAAQWNKVQHLLTPMHSFFTTDKPWMKQCIPNKIRNPKNKKQVNWPMNNWIKHTHWKIIVIGEEDSGMFFHADGFSTSTFVFQFIGRKRWTLCKPDPYMKYMENAGVIDTFGKSSVCPCCTCSVGTDAKRFFLFLVFCLSIHVSHPCAPSMCVPIPPTSTGSKEHVSKFPKYKQADCKQFNVNPGEVKSPCSTLGV